MKALEASGRDIGEDMEEQSRLRPQKRACAPQAVKVLKLMTENLAQLPAVLETC